MKNHILLIILLTVVIVSCNQVKQGTKDTLNKGGEVVGKTATEFLEGVSEGVEKTLQCEVSLSEKLKENGLSTGKYTIENGKEGGNDNLLVLYIIFEKDFNAELTAKAFGKDGLEIGRVKLNVEGNAGDAGYFDFVFDKRTYLEVKSKIVIE